MYFQNQTDHLTVQVSWPAGPVNYSTKSVMSTALTCCSPTSLYSLFLISLWSLSYPSETLHPLLSEAVSIPHYSRGLVAGPGWAQPSCWWWLLQLFLASASSKPTTEVAAGYFFCLYKGGVNPSTGGAQSKVKLSLWMRKTVNMSSQQCYHNIIALMAFSTQYLHVHQLLQTSHILNHAMPLTQREDETDS